MQYQHDTYVLQQTPRYAEHHTGNQWDIKHFE